MKNLVPFRDRVTTSLIDEMFDMRNFFGNSAFSGKSLYANVSDEKDKYVVKAEVPGLSEEDVKVDYDNGTVSIEATYKEETKNSFRSGSWNWSYYIPNVDTEKINASIKNGILTIDLPKQEKPESKKIQITSN